MRSPFFLASLASLLTVASGLAGCGASSREWEALLHYNGFETTAVEGDFEGGPLVQSSDVMVWHARRRRR